MSKEVARSIRLNFRISEDRFFRLENDFNMIHHYLGGNESETRLAVWEAGIESLLKDVAEGATEKAKEASRRVAIIEKIRAIKQQEEDWRLLEKIFDSLSAEEFQKWCTEKDIDMVSFMEWHEARNADSRGEEYERWLSNQLKDGQPVPTVVIKQRAIEEGMIDPDDPQQWSYLRVIAGRKGYISKRRGFWQNGVHHRAPAEEEVPF